MPNGTSKCFYWMLFSLETIVYHFLRKIVRQDQLERRGQNSFSPHKMTKFSTKAKKIFFSKTAVNPFRKKFQFFLKNNFFSTSAVKIAKQYSNMIILPQKFLKCVYKDVVDQFACFVEQKKRILKVLVMVKIWSFFKNNHLKSKFLLLFFLTPPFSRSETDKLPKKSHRPSQMTKVLTKNFFMTF